MRLMSVSLEKVYEELRCLPPEKLAIVASVIHAFNIEEQGEAIHPEWTAVLDRRSTVSAEEQIELIDAEEVDAYVNRALDDTG